MTERKAAQIANQVYAAARAKQITAKDALAYLAKMCTLRLHPEAQYEARLVAEQVYGYLKEYYPVGAKALVEGV